MAKIKSHTSKLNECIKNNKRDCTDLYDDPSKVELVDYILCPVYGIRMRQMKTTYITGILKMSMEEFETKYPNFQRDTSARADNVKKGLTKIDPNTGLTKHRLSVEKSKVTLSTPDENGETGYDKKGQKTRATHMSNVNEHGQNGYSQIATKAIIKGNATKVAKGLILPPEERDDFYRYKIVVTTLTERLRKKLNEGYCTGLAGESGAYHIDHMYSTSNGFKNGISPLIIGNIANLKMIPWEENIEKHAKSSIDIERLFEDTGYTKEQSDIEFGITMEQIELAVKNETPVSGAYIVELLNEAALRHKQQL
jgi:hypothetical protein